MPGAESLSVQQPVMQAGDVIIWNNLLPHGSGLNTSDAPRIGYNLSLNPIGTMPLHFCSHDVARRIIDLRVQYLSAR